MGSHRPELAVFEPSLIVLASSQARRSPAGQPEKRRCSTGPIPRDSPPGREIAEKRMPDVEDRKSTRLNSSHVRISYAVVCLTTKKPPALDAALEAIDSRVQRQGQEERDE